MGGYSVFVQNKSCKQINSGKKRKEKWKLGRKMGNMLMNKRIEETILGGNANSSSRKEEGEDQSSDYRILPKHMYGGPKGLGDPMFRGLSKMEEDPMIPQRMR